MLNPGQRFLDTYEFRAARRAVVREYQIEFARALFEDATGTWIRRHPETGFLLAESKTGWGWFDPSDGGEIIRLAKTIGVSLPDETATPFAEIFSRSHNSGVKLAHRVTMMGGRWGTSWRPSAANPRISETEVEYLDGRTEWLAGLPQRIGTEWHYPDGGIEDTWEPPPPTSFDIFRQQTSADYYFTHRLPPPRVSGLGGWSGRRDDD